MASVTLPTGNVVIYWSGSPTVLSQQSWFTTTNLTGIYKQSSNGLSFISAKPGASFPGFTTLQPSTGGLAAGYIFRVATPFSLDSSLLGIFNSTSNTYAATYETLTY